MNASGVIHDFILYKKSAHARLFRRDSVFNFGCIQLILLDSAYLYIILIFVQIYSLFKHDEVCTQVCVCECCALLHCLILMMISTKWN